MVKKSFTHILIGLLCGISGMTCLANGNKEQNAVTIAIFALNDFHGAIVQDERKDVPGAANVIETLDSLKRIYPHNVIVSAGDNFGGSYFSTATNSSLIPAFFNYADICISVLGNHEFDNGQEFIAQKFQKSKFHPKGWDIEYVCANIKNLNEQYPDYVKASCTKDILISPSCTLKVAFTGLLTASTPTQTRASNIKGLVFNKDYIREIQYARTESDINILLSHIGSNQKTGKPSWDDPQFENLKNISKNDFHGLITAHTHELVCGRINEDSIPIVQGDCNGTHIAMLKCLVDTTTKEVVSVVPELIRVNKHLQFGTKASEMQRLIDITLKDTKTEAGFSLNEYLTEAKEELIHNRKQKFCFTEVASLVCESYAEAFRNVALVKSDEIVIGISHFGSIRAGFPKGKITVLDIGEVLPFFNELYAFRLQGRDLKKLVEFGLHNDKYGWLQMSDLEIFCNNPRDKKVIVLYYKSSDGRRIKLKSRKRYTVIADEYISNGGDGYAPSFFPKEQKIEIKGMPKSTDAFISYLKTKDCLHKDIHKTERLTYNEQ